METSSPVVAVWRQPDGSGWYVTCSAPKCRSVKVGARIRERAVVLMRLHLHDEHIVAHDRTGSYVKSYA